LKKFLIINKKNEEDNKKDNIISYFYYLIITFEEIQNNLEKIICLSAEFGITFIIILYVEENKKDNTLIHKKYTRIALVSIILVYSLEDILRYFSKTFDFHFPINLIEIKNYFDLNKLNQIKTLDQNKEFDYQDGCFELAETFDTKLITNKSLIIFYDNIDYSSISTDIYHIYKEHNALDLFFSQNIKYFQFNLINEMIFLDICFIKKIIYMYCREEIEREKSFYRMINEDLRTKDPSKIDRFFVL